MRKKLSIKEIMDMKMEGMSNKELAELPYDYVGYVPQLYKSLSLSSYTHGYSLAIEYMVDWFNDTFKRFNKGKEFFKSIHVNGKYVLDDWKQFNRFTVKKEKPMLAVVPTVDYEYDRENIDAYLADPSILLHRSDYNQSFFKNYDTMTFIYMQMRALRMNFAYKVRVSTRAQQLDLLSKMELYFRIGATETRHASMDLHVPYEIMLNVAELNNFKIKKDKIVEIPEFLSFMNQHSDFPIIYKMRAITQKPEFFVRVRNLPIHISHIDKISVDDGDREGKLDTNFHLEMQATVTIPVPHFFAFMNQKPLIHTINLMDDAMVGICTINPVEVPYQDHNGWDQVLVTEYLTDIYESTIDISPLLMTGGNVTTAIELANQMHIDCDSFLNVVVYNSEMKILPISMDWEHVTIRLPYATNQEESLVIAIYTDKQYVNHTAMEMDTGGRVTDTTTTPK